MDFFLHIIVLIAGYIPSLLGYNLVFGKGKIFHFGPLGVSLFAAYAFAIVLMSTRSYLMAILASLVIVLLISAVFAWLAQRLEPDGFGVMSIAMHLSILAVVLNWNSLTRGALGIPRIPRMPFLNSVADFAIAGVSISLLCVAAFWLLDRGRFGRQLAALAEHEWHAKSLGIYRGRVQLIAFLIAGVGATISNVFFIQYLTILHPNDYQFPSFVFWIMVIVAGRPGSVLGVALSTVLLVILREGLRFVPLMPAVLGPIRLILFGVILLVAVWLRRDTLFPHERKI